MHRMQLWVDYIISIHAPREGGDLPAVQMHHLMDISIHAPREGGDLHHIFGGAYRKKFQSTPPARGATRGAAWRHKKMPDFNPRPPRGGRPPCAGTDIDTRGFQSTPPARGATGVYGMDVSFVVISIHAPRKGGRPKMQIHQPRHFLDFNPRPPRGGATQPRFRYLYASLVFQSTPPARGGDLIEPGDDLIHADFNPRPPRGGATNTRHRGRIDITISIHAPREGGRHQRVQVENAPHMISIHAPREGGDTAEMVIAIRNRNFNPRPPRGGRPGVNIGGVVGTLFQSTPPARGATGNL